MADESPEQIRERVHAEELAKGSDPRVAEGRAKAAEMRARHDLPVEPDAAWRALLEREGGTATAVAEAPPATAEEAPPAPAEPVEAPPAEEAPVEAVAEAEAAPVAAAPPAAAVAEVPPGAAVERDEVVYAPAPVAVPLPETEFEPEIGGKIEIDTEAFDEIAGIKLRDPVLPRWLLVALLIIPLLAAAYIVVFSGSEGFGTGCRVEADRSLVCFITEETPAEP